MRDIMCLATLLSLLACLTGPLEKVAMSSPSATASQRSEVASALGEYDKTRRAESLRRAADAAVREDGNPPADPATAPTEARERIRMWIDILSRFKRDLDPNFDPSHPPSQAVQAPVVHGQRVMPLRKPSDIKDPEERAALENAIAERDTRVQRFEAMATLAAVHDVILEKAEHSLVNARDLLGISAAEIDAALADSDIAPDDRKALHAAISG
jgi:hypothetical protein